MSDWRIEVVLRGKSEGARDRLRSPAFGSRESAEKELATLEKDIQSRGGTELTWLATTNAFDAIMIAYVTDA